MIRVRDIAYVRFSVPDLDEMTRFAADFGLALAERTEDAVYHRGTDPSSYCHVAERGEPGFRCIAFEAQSSDDLVSASELPGASAIEAIEAPGGGQRVRLTDPTGFLVEIVHGRATAKALPVAPGGPINRGSHRERLGAVHRPPKGPSSVKRLGHAVLKVADLAASRAWYQERLGFLSSDEIYLGEPDNLIAAFMRCDRGSEFTDHHTLAVVQLGEPGFEHAAFEVEDVDRLMAGHDHLAAEAHTHHAGVGRHVLGSQIFDYWQDPWGHTVEHYTDGDLLDASAETGLAGPEIALGTLWGQAPAPG